jgi:hypothetical protein
MSGPSPHRQTARPVLILFFARLFAAAFAGERFFHPLLFAGLQVKGMSFHFLDDVFLLYLPLETAKRVLEGLALLNSDFSQLTDTPQLVRMDLVSYGKHWPRKSSGM